VKQFKEPPGMPNTLLTPERLSVASITSATVRFIIPSSEVELERQTFFRLARIVEGNCHCLYGSREAGAPIIVN
jgi:hypothetical protein